MTLLFWWKKSVYGYGMSSFALCVASLAPSSAFSLPSISECPGIQLSSICFPFCSRSKMLCSILLILLFEAARDLMTFSTLYESEKLAKTNLLRLLIVFSAMWLACASAVNMIENSGKEAEDVVAPTPSLFLDPSVCRYVH